MKTIQIKIRVIDDKRIENITLEKHGPDDEMEVLASSVSTIFLKSREALGMAKRKGKSLVSIGKKS